MNACIVTIADSEEMARTLDRYIRCFLGQSTESYFMTYEHNLLSGTLFRQADLFVLELLRKDDLGYRAEALFASEKWLPLGKKVLIVSGSAYSSHLDSSLYWDLSSAEPLSERLEHILREPVPSAEQLDSLKIAFQKHYRPAVNYHKRKTAVG